MNTFNLKLSNFFLPYNLQNQLVSGTENKDYYIVDKSLYFNLSSNLLNQIGSIVSNTGTVSSLSSLYLLPIGSLSSVQVSQPDMVNITLPTSVRNLTANNLGTPTLNLSGYFNNIVVINSPRIRSIDMRVVRGVRRLRLTENSGLSSILTLANNPSQNSLSGIRSVIIEGNNLTNDSVDSINTSVIVTSAEVQSYTINNPVTGTSGSLYNALALSGVPVIVIPTPPPIVGSTFIAQII